MTARWECAFAIPFSELSCAVLVVIQEEVSGKTSQRGRRYSLHLEPLRHSMSLSCGQCAHIAYAEVKGRKRRRLQVLEYLDHWRSEAKINKNSWVNVLRTSNWKRAGGRHTWGHQWTIHLSTESGQDKKKELPKRTLWTNYAGSSQTQNSRTAESQTVRSCLSNKLLNNPFEQFVLAAWDFTGSVLWITRAWCFWFGTRCPKIWITVS